MEDHILLQKTRALGFKWTRIASFLPNRSEADVKARCNFLSRVGLSSESGVGSEPSAAAASQAASQGPGVFVRQRLPSLIVNPACPSLFPLEVFGPRDPDPRPVGESADGVSAFRS